MTAARFGGQLGWTGVRGVGLRVLRHDNPEAFEAREYARSYSGEFAWMKTMADLALDPAWVPSRKEARGILNCRAREAGIATISPEDSQTKKFCTGCSETKETAEFSTKGTTQGAKVREHLCRPCMAADRRRRRDGAESRDEEAARAERRAGAHPHPSRP